MGIYFNKYIKESTSQFLSKIHAFVTCVILYKTYLHTHKMYLMLSYYTTDMTNKLKSGGHETLIEDFKENASPFPPGSLSF